MDTAFIDQIKDAFAYNPRTGVITWSRTGRRMKAGAIAGSKRAEGYWQIKFMNKTFMAHRIAWAIFYGKPPEFEVDHINGIRTDNRISNLRDLTRQQNSENRSKPRVGSKSGLIGASYQKKTGSWRSSIMKDGVYHVIGSFDTKEAAHEAYITKKRELHAFGTI